LSDLGDLVLRQSRTESGSVPSGRKSSRAIPVGLENWTSLTRLRFHVFLGDAMRHEYIGKVASDEEQERQAERDRLDAQWKRKRIDAESARQKLHQAKLLEMKGELISRRHVTKQASFLVLSLRARLLALGGTLASRIARACGRRRARDRESDRRGGA
jgi:hypothetical protein